MIELEITFEGASPAQLEAAVQAAMAVFAKADVDPYDAYAGLAMLEDWDDRGFPEDTGLSDRELRALDAFSEAQTAASEVLGCPDGSPVMLGFREV